VFVAFARYARSAPLGAFNIPTGALPQPKPNSRQGGLFLGEFDVIRGAIALFNSPNANFVQAAQVADEALLLSGPAISTPASIPRR
jgi:hypothetical protein